MTTNPLEATISLRGIIFSDSAILLVERATDGGWELPGGRLGADEDTIPGLEREIAEETGITPDILEPIHTLSWHNTDGQGRFAVYYRCQCNQQEVVLSPEHTDAEWVSVETAQRRLSEPQSKAVSRATNGDRQLV